MYAVSLYSLYILLFSSYGQMGHQDLLAILGYDVETKLDVFMIEHRKQTKN